MKTTLAGPGKSIEVCVIHKTRIFERFFCAFWTCFAKLDIQEINRVFNFVIKTKEKTWSLKTETPRKKIMNFDYGNKQFKSIIKNF